jgi:hypothetical protein
MKGQGLFRRVKDFFTPKTQKVNKITKETPADREPRSIASQPDRLEDGDKQEVKIPQNTPNKYRKNNRKTNRARLTQLITMKDGSTKQIKHVARKVHQSKTVV